MMEHANLAGSASSGGSGRSRSTDRARRESGPRSIYTRELLRKPGAGVGIFPQGKILGNDVRPLDFESGLRAIVRRAGRVRIIPTALRDEFWQDERPEAFVRFGEPTWAEALTAGTIVVETEARLIAELDRLRDDVVAQRADRFATLFEGRRSISDRYASSLARGRRGSD